MPKGPNGPRQRHGVLVDTVTGGSRLFDAAGSHLHGSDLTGAHTFGASGGLHGVGRVWQQLAADAVLVVMMLKSVGIFACFVCPVIGLTIRYVRPTLYHHTDVLRTRYRHA